MSIYLPRGRTWMHLPMQRHHARPSRVEHKNIHTQHQFNTKVPTEKCFTTTTGPKTSSCQSSSSVFTSAITVGGRKLPFEKSNPSKVEFPAKRVPPARILLLPRLCSIPSIRSK